MSFEAAKSVLLIVSALFPIVNPIGGSPVFLLLTQDYSAESRKLLARRVAMNSFILLIVSVVVGTHILRFSGFRFRWCDRGRPACWQAGCSNR